MTTRRTCPRCQQPLVALEDHTGLCCPSCSGEFVPTSGGLHLLDGVEEPTSDATLDCPACSTRMRRVLIGGAESHRCPNCAGMWLDAPAAGNTETAATAGRRLLYCLTLPERALRSGVGLAAGAACEAAELLVPQAFHSSKTYEVVVRNSLRFLTDNVGGVTRSGSDGEPPQGEDFLARKAVGNFVDLAGVATLHVSPLWLLAIVSDAAYGSKVYLNELAAELRREGLIRQDSTIGRVEDLLDAIRHSSGHAAGLLDAPPLSVDELKQTLDKTRESLAAADYRSVLPEAELAAYWQEMREIAARENVSLLGVSGALTMHALGKLGTATQGTLTALRVAGGLLNRHVVGHYADALRAVRERGFYETVRASSAPYITAVWTNFAADRRTWTEQLVTGEALGRAWRTVRGWFKRPDTAATAPGGHVEPH